MSEDAPAERVRVWKTPAGVALCAESDIADPGSRGFVLQIGEAYFHGFVVRKDGEVAGWIDRCPHAGFPLAVELDRYLNELGGQGSALGRAWIMPDPLTPSPLC